VRNGKERGVQNLWIGEKGERVQYEFSGDTEITQIRLVFDSDLNRKYHNMPCNYPLEQEKFKLPATLITEYRIEGVAESGEKYSLEINENHQRFIKHNLDWKVKTLRFVPLKTNGSENFRLYEFEIK
jgi:hypothetical protein